MKNYYYVLATVHPDKNIDFHHTLIFHCKSESVAYDEGAKWAKSMGLLPVKEGRHANDYVIPLS